MVGDSAGHCLPTTAEGIRTALYFGLACGRELRAVVEGRSTRAEALERYAAFSRAHAWKFNAMLTARGVLCIADLDREDGSFHGAGFDGHNGFDRSELAAKAERAGFAAPRFSTAYTMTKAARTYPIFLMVAEKR